MVLILALAVTLIVSSADAGVGVSYVRWGRTVCPEEATLLYKGYMAGPHAGIGGSGANYLCVHDQPKFVRPIAGTQPWSAMIYGVEMELISPYKAGVFNNENVNGGELFQQDMVCVVCYVSGSSDQLMVPGRQDCGEVGYNLQYKGFLVAQAHTGRQRGNYVCMDDAPEGRPGGSGDINQSLVYPVQVGCGSLPCGPYVEGFEMPCSVCTF